MRGLFVLFLCALNAHAYENFCRTRSSEGVVPRVCKGTAPVPRDKTRNIRQDYQLSCGSSKWDFRRTPESIDQEHWHDLVLQDRQLGTQQAYEYRRSFAAPHWDRSMSYSTYEHWTWESCDLVTREHPCGVEWIEKTIELEIECPENSPPKKKCTRLEKTQVSKAKSCYVDVEHSEREFCSQENIQVHVDYTQPRQEEWHPKSDAYLDIIPNKYDLLPGEFESLSVSMNTGFWGSTKTLNWDYDIKNPVNQYRHSLGGTAVHATCAQGTSYKLDWRIETSHRVPSRSPNAFKISKLHWEHDFDNRGELVEAYPSELLFHDMGAFSMKKLSEESHDKKEVISPFFKDTQVRVQVLKKRWWWYWDQLVSESKHLADAIEPSLNPLTAKDSATRLADVWRLNLDYDSDSLMPERPYELRVSVYQRGVPIYHQSCEDVWPGKPCLKHDDEVFSIPYVLPFHTPAEVDKRSTFQVAMQWFWGEPLLHQLGYLIPAYHEKREGLRYEGYLFVDRWIEPTIFWGTLISVPMMIYLKTANLSRFVASARRPN